MSTRSDGADLDLVQYRADTADLIDSIEETTELFERMGDTMGRPGTACDEFASSTDGLRVATDGGRERDR